MFLDVTRTADDRRLDRVCVITEGRLDVTKDGQKLLTIEAGEVFGEVALLYNCTQIYSVTGTDVDVCVCVFFSCFLKKIYIYSGCYNKVNLLRHFNV